MALVLRTILQCPHCGFKSTETMPVGVCVYFHQCRACNAVVKPKPGGCCVYCCYATMPCPTVQQSGNRNGKH